MDSKYFDELLTKMEAMENKINSLEKKNSDLEEKLINCQQQLENRTSYSLDDVLSKSVSYPCSLVAKPSEKMLNVSEEKVKSIDTFIRVTEEKLDEPVAHIRSLGQTLAGEHSDSLDVICETINKNFTAVYEKFKLVEDKIEKVQFESKFNEQVAEESINTSRNRIDALFELYKKNSEKK